MQSIMCNKGIEKTSCPRRWMFIIVMSKISAFCQISAAKCTQTLTESLMGLVKNANGVVIAVVI